MKIETSAFKPGSPIPKKYTCQGTNISPPLIFREAPEGTVTFALIVDDPDAPRGTFDHWIAWNIPGTATGLAEGGKVVDQGTNGFSALDYQGPCPPPGKPHRYFFKLYALKTRLSLPIGSTKNQLEQAMEGNILEKAELIGVYQRE